VVVLISSAGGTDKAMLGSVVARKHGLVEQGQTGGNVPAPVTGRTIRPDRHAAKCFSKPMASRGLRLLPHAAELAAF